LADEDCRPAGIRAGLGPGPGPGAAKDAAAAEDAAAAVPSSSPSPYPRSRTVTAPPVALAVALQFRPPAAPPRCCRFPAPPATSSSSGHVSLLPLLWSLCLSLSLLPPNMRLRMLEGSCDGRWWFPAVPPVVAQTPRSERVAARVIPPPAALEAARREAGVVKSLPGAPGTAGPRPTGADGGAAGVITDGRRRREGISGNIFISKAERAHAVPCPKNNVAQPLQQRRSTVGD